MKYLSLVFFIFAIHLSISIYNSIGITAYAIQPDNSFLDAFSQNAVSVESYSQNVEQSENLSFGDYVKALFFFIVSFGIGVVILPYTMHSFGLSWAFSILFSAPLYFVYIIALVQILSKDSFKSKQ